MVQVGGHKLLGDSAKEILVCGVESQAEVLKARGGRSTVKNRSKWRTSRDYEAGGRAPTGYLPSEAFACVSSPFP